MRPVDTSSISHIETTNRGVARRHLGETIGWFCSYCELPIHNRPEREHVEATSQGGNPTSLANNLLACSICNSTKNNRIANRSECLWTDRDNTFLAYLYTCDGIVTVNPDLQEDVFPLAQRLYDACGLGKHPTPNQTSVDNRWSGRSTAWIKATDAKTDWIDLYKSEQNPQIRARHANGIARQTDGFFSIWMTVFHDEPQIKATLIEHVIGTAKDCFDASGNPIARSPLG